MSSSNAIEKKEAADPVESFKFHGCFLEESDNGLYFNNVYLPEEVVSAILSSIDVKEILNATLVCKKWCNIIKSDLFWFRVYIERYKQQPMKLPWYVHYCLFSTNYFTTNLLKNGNGQERFKHWKIVMNGGDHFRIENPPVGSEPLPLDISEFNGKRSCFATSFRSCSKRQYISLHNRLVQYIVDKYKPHIYLSEWIAGRFDCGCVYTLTCQLCGREMDLNPGSTEASSSDNFVGYFTLNHDCEQTLHVEEIGTKLLHGDGSEWFKIELCVKDYPSGVRQIVFQHEGTDTQFWKGHYGSKMAGGVVRLLFDSIKPC